MHMTTSMVTTGLRWLWGHKPDLVLALIIMIAAVWLTNQVNNFDHRLGRIEDIVIDIHERQIPEMRRENAEKFKQIDMRFAQIDMRFQQIEAELIEIKKDIVEIKKDIVEMKVDIVNIKLHLKKIDTYLSTKNKDYKGEE